MKPREAIAFTIHIFMNDVLEYNNNKSLVTQTDENTGPEPEIDKTELAMDPLDATASKVMFETK